MASPSSLRHVTLAETQRLMDTGASTSTQIVQTYVARITEVDHEFNFLIEPILMQLLTREPAVLSTAMGRPAPSSTTSQSF